MSADITEKKPRKAAAKKTAGDKEKVSTAPSKAKKAAVAKTAPTTAGEAATPPSKQTNRAPSYEAVAALAHRFFEERHCQHGFHEQDWLRAEQELLNA